MTGNYSLSIESGRRLLLLSVAIMLACVGASAQPTWTDIMNYTGYSNEASGVYWEFSGADTCYASPPAAFSGECYTVTYNTNIASTNSGTLNYPVDSGGNPETTGSVDPVCSTAVPSYWSYTGNSAQNGVSYAVNRVPQQQLTSYYGPSSGSYLGVGFLGTFGSGSAGTMNGDLVEAVYFHERACFFGGREYGFYYDRYNNSVYAYWEVNANCQYGGGNYCTSHSDVGCDNTCTTTDTQHAVSLGAYTGTEYYFEIYPTGNSSSCSFVVNIIDTSYNPLSGFPQTISVGSDITGVDPYFCSNVTGGEYGYVTAGVLYSPTISSLTSGNNLALSRVLVGK